MFSQQRVSMEVTALCIRQLMKVLVLLPAQIQHSYSHRADATFPRIVPSRLQFFEYESVSVNCEGFFNDLIEWKVMKEIKGITTICNDKWEIKRPCNITPAFTLDSGEYWCEAEGKKSNTVNIAVTGGSVILESPAPPVTGGDDVTLRCRNKKTSNSKADFYKDGVLIDASSTGELTIHSVSKSDEGLYKCNIAAVGESAESRLVVTAYQEETGSGSLRQVTLLWTVVIVLLVSLLLLLVLGLHFAKHKGASVSRPSSTAPSSPLQTVSAEASVDYPHPPTYAVVTKHGEENESSVAELEIYSLVTQPMKEKDEDEFCTAPAYYTLSLGPGVSSFAATPVPSESTNRLLREEDCFYSTIH